MKTESEVAQSCPTLSDPMDCGLPGLPGSSVHGIFQAGVLEWVAIAFSLAVARTSKTMLNNSGENRHPCLVPNLRGNAFSFHALEKEMATHSSSCLENPRDRGAWCTAVYGVAQSQTRLKQLSSSSRSWNSAFLHIGDSKLFLSLFVSIYIGPTQVWFILNISCSITYTLR